MIEIEAEAKFGACCYDLETVVADGNTEEEINAERFPNLVGPEAISLFKLQVAKFGLLFSTLPMFRRTAVACLMQFFQQMTGIDCIVGVQLVLVTGRTLIED